MVVDHLLRKVFDLVVLALVLRHTPHFDFGQVGLRHTHDHLLVRAAELRRSAAAAAGSGPGLPALHSCLAALGPAGGAALRAALRAAVGAALAAGALPCHGLGGFGAAVGLRVNRSGGKQRRDCGQAQHSFDNFGSQHGDLLCGLG